MEKRIYYLQLNQPLIDFFNQKHLDSSFKKTSTDISEQWLKAIWTQLFSFSSLSSHVYVLSNYTCQDRIVNYLYKYGRLVNPSCEDKLAGVRIPGVSFKIYHLTFSPCFYLPCIRSKWNLLTMLPHEYVGIEGTFYTHHLLRYTVNVLLKWPQIQCYSRLLDEY